LLFDEAQATYEDHHLWNTFFKRVHDGLLYYHAILFCSYGSPSANPLDYARGTPPLLRSAARVSLWHEQHSIGLLLNRIEFNEVVAGYAKRPERKLLLDPELQDHFYVLTGGHVGAVVELLHLVSYQVSLDSFEMYNLDFLTNFSRELTKCGMESHSQLLPLMKKIQFILLYNGSTLGLLDVA
jgi:hypothetical protein